MAKIYQAKMNINQKISDVYSNKLNLEFLLNELYEKINSNIEIYEEKNEVRYKFVQVHRDYKRSVVFGRLVKIHKERVVDIYQENEDDLADQTLKNYSESVPFSFNVRKEIISFVPNQYFRKERFIDIFRKILEKTYPDMGYINITILTDKEEFNKKFASIKSLGRFSAVLVPPNQADDLLEDMNDDIEGLVDMIKQSGAKTYTQELKTDIRNPLNKKSTFVQGLSKLANSGYGYLEVYGKTNEGTKLEINTREDRDMIKTIHIDEKLRDSPLEIMSIIEDEEV